MRHHRTPYAIAIVLLLFGAVSADAQLGNRFGTGNIVKVAKSGPGFRSIQAALDSITDASEDNPYLVYVAPGVYEEEISMRPYVAIQGSGERLTTIRLLSHVYAKHTEFRSLTIDTDRWIIQVFPQTSLTISNATIRSRSSLGVLCPLCKWYFKDVTFESKNYPALQVGTVGRADGVSILVDCDHCSGHLSGVVVKQNGHLDIVNSIIMVDGPQSTSGVEVTQGASVDASNVRIFSTDKALRIIGWDTQTAIRHSEVHGSVESRSPSNRVQFSHSLLVGEISGEGDVACFSVHDADLNPLDENCQPIP